MERQRKEYKEDEEDKEERWDEGGGDVVGNNQGYQQHEG